MRWSRKSCGIHFLPETNRSILERFQNLLFRRLLDGPHCFPRFVQASTVSKFDRVMALIMH
jgi:hypothetical protein